jgi:hypothetical protein
MTPDEVSDGYYWLKAEGIRDKTEWVPVQIKTVAGMPPAPRGDKMVYFFNAEEARLSNLLTYSKIELRRIDNLLQTLPTPPHKMQIVDGIARRCRIDLYTPAEAAIRNAVNAVEEVGAHPLLTDAVVLLSQAKDRVADFVELPSNG